MIGTQKEVVTWLLDQPKDKKYKIEEHKEKRSLNANSYAWSLMTKLGNVMRISKEEVYENMLAHYGQILGTLWLASNVDTTRLKEHYMKIGERKVDDVVFYNYEIMIGSSEYNSYEMSVFLDGIIHECEQVGIETLTPDELLRLKALWKGR